MAASTVTRVLGHIRMKGVLYSEMSRAALWSAIGPDRPSGRSGRRSRSVGLSAIWIARYLMTPLDDGKAVSPSEGNPVYIAVP